MLQAADAIDPNALAGKIGRPLNTGLGDQVADQIAVRTLLEIEAEKLGLVMPDSIVAEFLTKNEAFQNPSTGKFDQVGTGGASTAGEAIRPSSSVFWPIW